MSKRAKILFAVLVVVFAGFFTIEWAKTLKVEKYRQYGIYSVVDKGHYHTVKYIDPTTKERSYFSVGGNVRTFYDLGENEVSYIELSLVLGHFQCASAEIHMRDKDIYKGVVVERD